MLIPVQVIQATVKKSMKNCTSQCISKLFQQKEGIEWFYVGKFRINLLKIAEIRI